MSWRAALAMLLAIMFLVGAALIIGSRYGDLLGRWTYVGMTLSILSAISFTALTLTKAVEASDAAPDDRVRHGS